MANVELNVGIDAPVRPVLSDPAPGSSLSFAYGGKEKNGLKALAEGKQTDMTSGCESRVMWFVHPPDGKWPDRDAGAVSVTSSGTFYRDPSNGLHSLASGKARVAFQLTDVHARPVHGYKPDHFVAEKKTNGEWFVTFEDGQTGSRYACVKASDVRSDRYVGPSGLQGPNCDLEFDGATGGAEASHVPVSEAFSTMHVTAPMHRLCEFDCADAPSSQSKSKPTPPYAAEVPAPLKSDVSPHPTGSCDCSTSHSYGVFYRSFPDRRAPPPFRQMPGPGAHVSHGGPTAIRPPTCRFRPGVDKLRARPVGRPRPIGGLCLIAAAVLLAALAYGALSKS